MHEGIAIGRCVAKYREQRGLKPGQLAAFAGIPASYISRLENGDYSRPGSRQLEKIAKVLRIRVDDILRCAAEEPSEPEAPYLDLIREAVARAPREVGLVAITDLPKPHMTLRGFVPIDRTQHAQGKMLRATYMEGTAGESSPLLADGDLLIIDLDLPPEPGDLCLAQEKDRIITVRYADHPAPETRVLAVVVEIRKRLKQFKEEP